MCHIVIYLLDLPTNYVYYINQKSRDGSLPHVQITKRPSSVAIVLRKETGFIYHLSHSPIIIAIQWHAWEVRARFYQFGNDFCTSPYLHLQSRDDTDAALVWLCWTVFLKESVRSVIALRYLCRTSKEVAIAK